MMRLDRLRPLLCALPMLAMSCATVNGPASSSTAYVDDSQPTIVAFAPAAAAREPSDAARQALRSDISSALRSTERCLGADHMSYQVVLTDRIVVRGAGQERSFEHGQFDAPLVGALLLTPGANPRIVFATNAQALETMLPLTAGEYFGRQCAG